MPEGFLDFIVKILDKDPVIRKTAAEIKEDEWFDEVKSIITYNYAYL